MGELKLGHIKRNTILIKMQIFIKLFILVGIITLQVIDVESTGIYDDYDYAEPCHDCADTEPVTEYYDEEKSSNQRDPSQCAPGCYRLEYRDYNWCVTDSTKRYMRNIRRWIGTGKKYKMVRYECY